MSALLRTLAAAPLALAFTLLAAAPAQASVIYTYTGNPFTSFSSSPGAPVSYTAANHVTVVMQFADPLQANANSLLSPLAFTLTDGINTITQNSATLLPGSSVSTDADGNIILWNIAAQIFPAFVAGATIRTVSTNSSFDNGEVRVCGALATAASCDPDYMIAGGVGGAPGTWTVRNSTAVPEPSSLALIGLALAGLVARRRAR